MATCPSCGEENPDRFRLCGFCGTPLATSAQPHEVRKTVTIVFSDLKGSTALGETLDSEALREVMRRVLEEHGGAIEKYIGDAVMAVFGIPRAHEDDALRAVRAARGMQHALAELNDELERAWGVRLENRTGVNTGEVVVGDPTAGQRLVVGDAVNTAARLEQVAPPMEVLQALEVQVHSEVAGIGIFAEFILHRKRQVGTHTFQHGVEIIRVNFDEFAVLYAG